MDSRECAYRHSNESVCRNGNRRVHQHLLSTAPKARFSIQETYNRVISALQAVLYRFNLFLELGSTQYQSRSCFASHRGTPRRTEVDCGAVSALLEDDEAVLRSYGLLAPLLLLAGLFAAKNEGMAELGGSRLLGTPVAVTDELREGPAELERVTKASIWAWLSCEYRQEGKPVASKRQGRDFFQCSHRS